MKRLGGLGLVLLAACHGPTPVARPTVSATPIAKEETKAKDKELDLENAMGILVEEILSTSSSEYGDRAITEYVAQIGARIAKRSERPEIVWHFRVTDTPDVGAHALPGGRITITRGLLAFLGSEAEVAAVLAHEIAHVSFRHSHSKWSPSVPVAEYGADATARERARDADQERQADTVGIRYLAEAGYDPNAMVTALAALERGAALEEAKRNREEKRDPRASSNPNPSLEHDFDPHPAPPTRLARASVAAGSPSALLGRVGGKGEWGREAYFAKIAGLEWGDGGSVPVLSGSRFIARGEISFAVPRGYRAKAERGTLEAKPPSGAAALAAFRVKKSFLSEVLRASVTKGQHATRTVAGWPALVARAPDPKAKKKDEKKGETLMAILDGPPGADGAQPVIIVFVNGNTAASERLLDAFLASAERDATPRTPSAVLAIERTDTAMRFDELVRRRCGDSSNLELAIALNGRAAEESLAPGARIKCVKQP